MSSEGSQLVVVLKDSQHGFVHLRDFDNMLVYWVRNGPANSEGLCRFRFSFPVWHPGVSAGGYFWGKSVDDINNCSVESFLSGPCNIDAALDYRRRGLSVLLERTRALGERCFTCKNRTKFMNLCSSDRLVCSNCK